MAIPEIADFVFFQLLRIDPSSTLITGDVGRDILFAIIIPAAVGLLILYEVIGSILGQGHKGLRILFGIGALGAVIYLGLYEIIAQFSTVLFFLWFGLFAFNKIFMRTAGNTGKKFIGGIFGFAGRGIRGIFMHMDAATKTRVQSAARLMVANIRLKMVEEERYRRPGGLPFAFGGVSAAHPTHGIMAIEETIAKNLEVLTEVVNKYGIKGKKMINEAVKDAVTQISNDATFIPAICPNVATWESNVKNYWDWE